MTSRRTLVAVAAAASAVVVGVAAVGAPAATSAEAVAPATRSVLFVGNNWDGTVDVVTPDDRLRRLGRINVIPDIEKRMSEIYTDPVRLGYYLGIRQLVGEGHDQYVDDMYTSRDGRLLVVSRPSLADVVAIRISTGRLAWRFKVAGQRSDHMAISPDGRRVAVSASTGNVVHELDIRTGEEVGRFPTGDSPH
jgi:opacity protein-like surface antigen